MFEKWFAVTLVACLTAAPASRQCHGCIGQPGTGLALTSGSGIVSLSITLANHGKCKVFLNQNPEPGEPTFVCVDTKGCDVNVRRTWTGFTPGLGITACVQHSSLPEPMCIPGLVVDGDGAGEDTRSGVPIPCGDSATFSINVDGQVATGSFHCSNCPDGG